MGTLWEQFHFALGSNMGAIVAGNALSTGDYICLKNAHMAYCIVVHDGANDTDLTVSFKEATAVAGTSAAAITATFPFVTDANFGSASDTLARGTDAANKAIDPATENPSLTIFQIDPAKLSAGFDCIAVVGTGGHASNNVCVLWMLESRYPADPPPTVITD
jgi:hypothetical protein